MNIKDLKTYPLKSAKGLGLTSMDISEQGPAHDREYVLVHAEGENKGRFISQRDKGCEKLALVQTRIDPASSMPIFALPNGAALYDTDLVIPDITTPVSVWSDTNDAFDMGDRAAEFFSDYLNTPCRLIRAPQNMERYADQEWSPDQQKIRFPDGFPLLLTFEESLQSLSDNFQDRTTVHMNDFRSNIVISGLDPFEEDTIDTIRIGDVVLQCVKPCTRCKMTMVDQFTGAINPHKDPLATLGRLRKGNADGLSGTFFGQNAIVLQSGTINLGAQVEILSRKELHPAIKQCELHFGN